MTMSNFFDKLNTKMDRPIWLLDRINGVRLIVLRVINDWLPRLLDFLQSESVRVAGGRKGMGRRVCRFEGVGGSEENNFDGGEGAEEFKEDADKESL